MKNKDSNSKVNEMITKEMIEDKEFSLSIMNCKDRAEVKALLASHGIDAGDNDIDVLAQNISEAADICKKLDEKDLENISGGAIDWSKVTDNGAQILGWGLLGLGVIGILSVVGVWIKKTGDEKGWWKKRSSGSQS